MTIKFFPLIPFVWVLFMFSSCYNYCSAEEAISSLEKSYKENSQTFDFIADFLTTNRDDAQGISYYNYEYIITFNNQNQKTVYLPENEILMGLEKHQLNEIERLDKIIALMKTENLEGIYQINGAVSFSSYCGSHLENGNMVITNNSLHIENGLIKRLNEKWAIVEK